MHDTRRVFDPAEWPLRDESTGERYVPGSGQLISLAEMQAGATYRIYQLMSGKVIVVVIAQFIRHRGDPHLFVVGEERDYADALRYVAHVVDTL